MRLVSVGNLHAYVSEFFLSFALRRSLGSSSRAVSKTSTAAARRSPADAAGTCLQLGSYGYARRPARRSAQPHRPQDPHFEGTFAIVVNRAPGNVWDVEYTADGRIRRIKRKEPKAWVNHYAFHILDREWGI
jgi:hypothetical protein